MNNRPLLPERFRPLLPAALIYLTAGLGLRCVLWWGFGRTAGAGWSGLAIALPLGMVNDLVVLLSLFLPLTLLLAVMPKRLLRSHIWRWLTPVCAGTLVFGSLYLGCVEYFFFDEFNARFNLVAVDYLIYPHEVFINIWESYHVIRYLTFCALATALIVFLLRNSLFKHRHPSLRHESGRWLLPTAHLTAMLLALFALSTGSLAVSGNRVTNEIIANGISSLFRALHTNELDYTAYYATMKEDRAFGLMRDELSRRGGTLADSGPHDITRRFPERAGDGPRNVVVVVEESFGAQFIGAYGDDRGLTPNFDRLSSQGLLFANAFASGTRTVRGLEAIVTSMPPIPSEGIIKRPGSWPMANWGEVLSRLGYHTSFLYGGFGIFDNMNPFFGGNGFAIIDRKSIDQVTFSNIWGVCDQDLFNHALSYFDGEAAANTPFFSVIMTTSNHSPYTFPEGIPGVRPSKGKRRDGIRYADFALGEFIDKAASHAWYDNTIFVVVADHDARVYGREQIPLRHYRIPLLVLAPGTIAPGRVTTATSQIDIAPTVMGLLGLPYQAPFYGQDVLHIPAGQPRPILLNHDHDVGLLLADRLAVLGLQQEISCYQVDGKDHLTPMAHDPALSDLTTAYFQTAYALFQTHAYQLPATATVVGSDATVTPSPTPGPTATAFPQAWAANNDH